jgi:hypothetical protein
MCICCIKCGCGCFRQTCQITHEETHAITFYDDGQVEQRVCKDSDNYSQEGASAYRCSKCGWELRDNQGTPLLKAEEIKQWAEAHKEELKAVGGWDDLDDA